MATGGSWEHQAKQLGQPVDVLIGTPQRVLQHAERGNLFYGDVKLVVLDEADTMFDAGFGPEVRALLGPLRSKAEPAGCVLVAATLSKVRSILGFRVLSIVVQCLSVQMRRRETE